MWGLCSVWVLGLRNIEDPCCTFRLVTSCIKSEQLHSYHTDPEDDLRFGHISASEHVTFWLQACLQPPQKHVFMSFSCLITDVGCKATTCSLGAQRRIFFESVIIRAKQHRGLFTCIYTQSTERLRYKLHNVKNNLYKVIARCVRPLLKQNNIGIPPWIKYDF